MRSRGFPVSPGQAWFFALPSPNVLKSVASTTQVYHHRVPQAQPGCLQLTRMPVAVPPVVAVVPSEVKGDNLPPGSPDGSEPTIPPSSPKALLAYIDVRVEKEAHERREEVDGLRGRIELWSLWSPRSRFFNSRNPSVQTCSSKKLASISSRRSWQLARRLLQHERKRWKGGWLQQGWKRSESLV